MRIIGGNFKSKKLFLPKDKNTRPLKDIVKESIFNLIQHSKKINLDIENSLVLDLFYGTGSFGIECISRGAKKVVFFEDYPEAIKVLKVIEEKFDHSFTLNKHCFLIDLDLFKYF